MALNDDIADKITSRSLNLNRYTAHVQRKTRKLLKDLEHKLSIEIEKADVAGTTRTAYQRARLEKLLTQTRETIRTSYRGVKNMVSADMVQLAQVEAVHFAGMANSAIGVDLVTVAVSKQQLRAIASDTLIQGAPSKEWWGRQAEDLRKKFGDQVREGMIRGETNQKIVQRVRGTKANGYADGIMQAKTRQAEALVRTSVQTVANEARVAVMEENQDIVKGVSWLSTLDGRTTLQCIALSGLQWSLPDYKPIGHDQPWPGTPPIHWGCRSTVTSVLKSFEELSKSRSVTTEAGGKSDARAIFERNLREQGFSEEKIKKAVMNARSSMDGQVPRDLKFGDWLSGKPKKFQDDLLGPGRADLWRDGKIALTDLIDQKARPLTLAQLKNL